MYVKCRWKGEREREGGTERFVIDSNSTQVGVPTWCCVSTMHGIGHKHGWERALATNDG